MLPQGMMYGMRGQMGDGNSIRNRGMEQNYTNSGNPNMPMFNARNLGGQQAQATMPVQASQTQQAYVPPQMAYAQGHAPMMPSWQAMQPQAYQSHSLPGYSTYSHPQQMQAPNQPMQNVYGSMQQMPPQVQSPNTGIAQNTRGMLPMMPMIRR